MNEQSNGPVFQIRNVLPQERPKFAVTKINRDGTGEDIAWFFKLETAELFQDWMEAHYSSR